MEPLALYLSLNQNRALNPDKTTGLRSLSLVQGETYAVDLSLLSGSTQITPAVTSFAFQIRNAAGNNVTTATGITQAGSGYNFTLPLTSPALASTNYGGYFSFLANGTAEIIAGFPIVITPTAGSGNAGYVSSINGLDSDISISGQGSISVTKSGQNIIVYGSAPTGDYATNAALTAATGALQAEYLNLATHTGDYYPRTNPSGYITSSALAPYATTAALAGATGTLQAEITGNFAQTVHLTGDQTIDGAKNFSTPYFYGVAFGVDSNALLSYNGSTVRASTVTQVETETDRFALSAGFIANGDLIKQTDIQHAWLVIDATQLGNVNGYVDLGEYPVFPENITPPAQDTSVSNVGDAFTVTNTGTWNTAGTISYQWQFTTDPGSSWTDIDGETAFQTVPDCSRDLGYLRCMVTLTHGSDTASSPTNYIGGLGLYPPGNTVPPAVTGSPSVGQTLTTDNGSWNGCDISYNYQWYFSTDNSSWTSILGATDSTWVIVGSAGIYVKCTVSAINSGGTTPADSSSIGPVANPPSVASSAAIYDTTNSSTTDGTVGDTLNNASSATFNGDTSGGIVYEWYLNGTGTGVTGPVPIDTTSYGAGIYTWVTTAYDSNSDSAQDTSNSISIS